MKTFERTRGTFTVSDDSARLDVAAVHAYLTRSYWATGVPLDIVERSIESSLCLGLYKPAPARRQTGEANAKGEEQIGFARVVTDRATFAYLCDVYVLEAHRGQGLGVWLMGCVLDHPDLQGLRRLLLTTQDAHGLYEKVGFVRTPFPERFMVIDRPTLYRS